MHSYFEKNDSAAQAMADYNNSLKETGRTADDFLIKLQELAIGFEMVAGAQLAAGFTTGVTNTRMTQELALTKKRLEPAAAEQAVDAAKGSADEENYDDKQSCWRWRLIY